MQGWICNDPENTNQAFDPKYALFGNCLMANNLYLSPTDKSTITVAGKLYPKLGSYAMNCYLGWSGAWDDRLGTGYRVFQKQRQFNVAMLAGTSLFAVLTTTGTTNPRQKIRIWCGFGKGPASRGRGARQGIHKIC